MKTPVSLLLVVLLMAGEAVADTESQPDEALLEFLASFDTKDSEFLDAEMEDQQQQTNASVSGEAHD